MSLIGARFSEDVLKKFEELRAYYETKDGKDLNNRELLEIAIDHLYENVFDRDVIESSQQKTKDMIFDEMTNLLGSTFTAFFQQLDEINTKLNLVDSKIELDLLKAFELSEVVELIIRMIFMADPITKAPIRPRNANEVDEALERVYPATKRTNERAKDKLEKNLFKIK